jgi:hypothetical protein
MFHDACPGSGIIILILQPHPRPPLLEERGRIAVVMN